VAGATLVVNTEACLRLTIRPAATSTALACLPYGELAIVEEGPIEGDGTIWWSLKSKRSAGYADQSSIEEQTALIASMAP